MFVHGSGPSGRSPRNIEVAPALNNCGFATLLFALLTADEAEDRLNVFDIGLLAERVADALRWLDREPSTYRLRIGLFGAGTGAAAALVAGAKGKGDALVQITAPTLLTLAPPMKRCWRSTRPHVDDLSLVIVPGASHHFPEEEALGAVVRHAERWFARHVAGSPARAQPLIQISGRRRATRRARPDRSAARTTSETSL